MPPKKQPAKRKEASALVGGPGVQGPKRTAKKGEEPKVVRAKWRETLMAADVDPFDLIKSSKRCQGAVVSLAGDVGIRPCLEPRAEGSIYCEVCGRAPDRQARFARLLRPGWEEILLLDLAATAPKQGRQGQTYRQLREVKRPEVQGRKVVKAIHEPAVAEERAVIAPLARPVPSWKRQGK